MAFRVFLWIFLILRIIDFLFFPILERSIFYIWTKILSSHQQISTPRHFQSEECPICLAKPRLPLVTNCGHIFCGPCMRTYWRATGGNLQILSCPICRSQMNRLDPLDSSSIIFSNRMANNAAVKDYYMTLYDFITNFNNIYEQAKNTPLNSLARNMMLLFFKLVTLLLVIYLPLNYAIYPITKT